MSKTILANRNTCDCNTLETCVPAVDTVTQEQWPRCSALVSPLARTSILRAKHWHQPSAQENRRICLNQVLQLDQTSVSTETSEAKFHNAHDHELLALAQKCCTPLMQRSLAPLITLGTKRNA